MAYDNNKFCWHGIISTDVDKAKAFYTEVVGWTIQTVEMGDSEAIMFAANDIPRCHVMAPPMPGVPSHWDNYFRVDDVDARTQAAVAAGGKVMVPPNDIPPGRFSVVTSPSGAAISFFHEADEATAQNPPPGPGAIHWTELHSQDLPTDLAWLKSTLGLDFQEMPMPDGSTYTILKWNDDMVGGAMKAMKDDIPSMWLTWVAIEDVDAAAERVKNNGGQVLAPIMDAEGIGRMAVVSDSTGGVFGLITPPPQA